VLKRLKDNRGNEMLEMIITTVVVILLMATCTSILVTFSKFDEVSAVCRRITRSIEVSGIVDSTTYSMVDELGTDSNLVSPTVSVDATYYDSAAGKIQIRDTFKVTVTCGYKVEIIVPDFTSSSVYVTLPLTARMTGMSEVFWK
jgi:hypothetical protein